ncbi:hypothetical protein [Pseudorhodoferax sp.]|uniref:hypothetical protein n=1 Tax=Pseudorhodoferax sp. TaxID=1993553 RepID=UPI002DD643F3|nr:hypothetical protein [Pseudorhodoferax sp.]
MKRLSLVAVLAAAALSGCVVAPVGPGYYGYRRPVVVAPAVVAPPVVVVRPGYDGRPDYGYGRRWRRDD